ncbi:uncharacterized protein LOC128995690 [Macrosteles quadrilineatus]|uniref:uncharacterized protein LOC128995690 n=1 Tax=Macrosteles quadrilineatus TaxID=74068 RepID=UPI0023E32F2B|nr:uncharacterized protein LOC128995690 [Macrosteles quadrilineatus]
MALLLRKLYETYRYVNEDLGDSRTADLPMMGSPFPTLALLVAYNMFVQCWGPRLMANRKPFNLDKILLVYNVFQVVASTYMFIGGFILGWGRDYNYFCEPVDKEITPHTRSIAFIVYLYYLLKVTDLLDTVFFVLRKKYSQVTFLHIYHHTGMVALSWSGAKWLPGGHDTFVGWVNSVVHIVMYSYYLITNVWPEYKKDIWWKKHITQLQMLQFFILILHSVALLASPDCGYPKFTAAVFIPQNTFMLILFYDFYRKAYLNKKTITYVRCDFLYIIQLQETLSRMAAIIRKLIDGYTYFNEDLADPRGIHYPLMSNPFGIVVIIVVYNLFVQWIGPNFMKDRKPYNLKPVIVVYDALQVVLNFWMMWRVLRVTYFSGNYNLLCEPVGTGTSPDELLVVETTYFYFLTKILDLLDTVFFILTKKSSHLSFLHLYHHSGMIACGWIGVKFVPGGQAVFFGSINGFVHCVMYLYYLLSALKYLDSQHIFWKRSLTQLQMVQFFLIALHHIAVIVNPDCDFPWFVSSMLIPQNIFIFILFADFYRKAYLKKDKKT